MEKRSRYFLTDEAAYQIVLLPWRSESDPLARKVRSAAILYGEARKAKLTHLNELQGTKGIGATLDRAGTIVNLAFHEGVHRTVALYSSNWEGISRTHRIIDGDLGKIGSHEANYNHYIVNCIRPHLI